MFRIVKWALALLVATPALAAPAAPATEGARVYAAASLKESIEAAAAAYAKTGHPAPVVVLASSSELARQIEAGAPPGVFISADQKWMDHVAQHGTLVTGSRANLLTNTLVLVVPAADPRRAKLVRGFDLASFVGDGRWATGDPESVPVGRYAKAALTALGAWDAAQGKLASAADTRAALAFVERGEAKAGIVYGTDAKASRQVRVAGVFARDSHPPIVYPIGLVGAAPAQARGFASWLRGPRARAIFRAAGFGIAP